MFSFTAVLTIPWRPAEPGSMDLPLLCRIGRLTALVVLNVSHNSLSAVPQVCSVAVEALAFV
jgi:hypothetical protein